MSFNTDAQDTTTQAQEPPRKRTATENTTGSNPSRSQHRQNHTAESNARARFLRELQQYASDDEDKAAASARSRGLNSDLALATSLRAQVVTELVSAPSATTHASSLASATVTGSSDFFFDCPDFSESSDVISKASAALNHRNDAIIGRASNNPPRVGLSLLHRMHAESTSSTSTNSGKANPNTSKSGSTFEVVHTYVPLSTGGFLSTASVGEDLMEGRQVRVGDVLSLRKLRSATPQSPDASGAFELRRAGVAADSSSNASNPASPNGNLSSLAPSLNSASPSPASSPGSPHVLSADSAQQALRHFKPAATGADDDRNYGRLLSPDMVRLLFEVTRVDTQGRTVEALFLDGTRVKLPFRDVRPAGYDEQKRYAQWKADPSSRPVTTIHSGAASPTSVSAPGTHPSSPVNATSASTAPGSTTAQSSMGASAAPWWVVPRLLVRVATEAAGDWYGKKCVVKAVRRNENTIRLTEWQVEAQGNSDSNISCAAETRELIGVGGLQTVVPKKGGRAMIVLGPRRGEMCTVRSRVRGPDGDLAGVEVEVSRTKEVVTLQAEELCALARQ